MDLEAIESRSSTTAVNFSDDFKVGSNFFIFGATATGRDFETDELTVVDLTSDEVFAVVCCCIIYPLDGSCFVVGRCAPA